VDTNKQAIVDRRGFLKLAGAGLGGLLLRPSDQALTSAASKDTVAVLYDSSKCIGCRICEQVCKECNNLPIETVPPSELSATTWNLIKKREGVDLADWPFFRYQCMHCTDAACVAVCPSGALYKDERGFTAYDREKCIGCGYCTQFCPYGVPHLETMNLLTGEAKMGKCTFCQDRIWSGVGGPACAEACPVGALVCGPRETLLDQAKKRVTTLHAQGLSDARLYGENEAGGLHRLSIIVAEPGQYNLPEAPLEPTLAHFWQTIVQPLGNLAFGATIVGLLGAFLISRRSIRMEEVR
jgi:formate dehydrogenase iron-sulfur subunit